MSSKIPCCSFSAEFASKSECRGVLLKVRDIAYRNNFKEVVMINDKAILVGVDGSHASLSLIHISEPTRPY